MQIGRDVSFFATALNSILCRSPFFIEGETREIEPYLRQILSFVPAYREVIVAGDVPKWVKYLPFRPREMPSEDLKELSEAVLEAFQEEGPGRPPIEFIYFSADLSVWTNVLKRLPRGWLATISTITPVLKDLPRDRPYFTEQTGDVSIVHFGERGRDISFETMLLDRVKERPGTVASFLIQKKLMEMYLAGQAILREMEEGAGFSHAEVEELFDLDETTLSKIIQMVRYEYELDLERYLKPAPPDVVEQMDSISGIGHLISISAVSRRQVIAIKRIKESNIPISCLARHIAYLHGRVDPDAGLGRHHTILLVSEDGYKVVSAMKDKVCYVLLFDKEARPALCVAGVKERLNIGRK